MEQENVTNDDSVKRFYLGLAHLFIGGLIYALLRNTDEIFFFSYLDFNYGQLIPSEGIPNFILFQVPDMLWAWSFILFTKAIKDSLILDSILFLWFVGLEISQLFFDWGTFDFLDLIAVCIPFAIIHRKRFISFF